MSFQDRPEARRRLGLLALVLFVSVFPAFPQDVLTVVNDRVGVLSHATGAVLEERDGSDALVRQVVLGPDGPLWQILADGSSQYMHEDPRGNVVMLTEGTGTAGASPGDVHERVTYDPFGKPTFQDASNQDRTGRTGEFADESELDNDLLFGGLLYDPEAGNRGSSPNNDFGGLYYVRGTRHLYNADEGRYVTRTGPVGEEIYPDKYGRIKVQFSTTAGNRYGLAGHAPVNALSSSSGGAVPGRPASRSRYDPALWIAEEGGADPRSSSRNLGLAGSGSSAGHEVGHHVDLGLMPDGAGKVARAGIAIAQLMDAVERSPSTGAHPWPSVYVIEVTAAATGDSSTLDYVEAQPPPHQPTGGYVWPSVYVQEVRAAATGPLASDLIADRCRSTYRSRHRAFAIVDRTRPTSGNSSCWIRVPQIHAAKGVVVKGKNILEN